MASPAAIDHLRALIGFDTVSRRSNLALIDHVEAFLKRHGVAGRLVFDETATKANLIATIGPAETPGYVLSGHTDVVPVDGQEWTTDPFALTQRGDRLFGRGTADMKGFVACCLAKVPAMVAAPLRRPLHLAFSYDEEVGCIGVRRLIAAMKDWDVRPLACFVGEPTDMDVVVSHKAKRSLRVTVTGRAAHSSLAPQAVNAVEYAALLIVRIREIGERLAHRGLYDAAFDVTHTTAHVGPIAGGTQLNIVPDRCVFEFEFRALPAEDVDALVEEVRRIAASELEPAMRRIAPEAGIGFDWISQFPGLDTDPEEPVVALAKRLAGRNRHGKVAYGTEAGLFSRDGGIPAVICGPGAIAQAHKPDEYIERGQLAQCETFLDRLVEHACQ